MKKVVMMMVCAALVLGARLDVANAFPQFDKQFKAKYNVDNPSSDAEKSLAEAVKEVKCNVCHEGTSKKMRNPYGEQLDNLLTKDDKENVDKIQEALDAVAKMSAPSGGTYGERISAGKLPYQE